MTKSFIAGVIVLGLLSAQLGCAKNHHSNANLKVVRKNNGFLSQLQQAKFVGVADKHIKSQAQAATGWIYGNTYFSGSNCADSNVATQFASATGLCIVLEMSDLSTTLNSAIYSCNGNTVQAMLYNGTTCDPSLLWQQHAAPVNQCMEGTMSDDENDDYLIGASQEEYFCTSSTAFPLPGAYDWVASVNYQMSDSTCNVPVMYNAHRNNYCYGYLNTAHTSDSSSFTTFPNDYGYSDAYCQKLSYISNLVTTCSPNQRYQDNTHTVFVSNTNNPVSSFVSFTSNITITGLTTSYLPSQSQFAVVNATAASMKLPMSSISYSGSHTTTVAAAATAEAGAITGDAVQVEIQSMHVQAEAVDKQKTAATTYSVVAVTKTSISVSTSSNANTVYTQYATALSTAVSNTQFTTYLQSASKTYNAYSTLTASGNAVSNSPATTTAAVPNTYDSSSSSSDSGLSTGAIAGIVVGSVVGAGLLIGLVFYFVFMTKASTPMAAQATDMTMNVVAGEKA